MPEIPPASYFQLVQGLREMAEDVDKNGRPYNPYTYSFGHDFSELLQTNSRVADAVSDALHAREVIDKKTNRRSLNASYAGNLALRLTYHNIFNKPDYPLKYCTPGSWSEDIEESVVTGYFPSWLPIVDAMSNIEKRYVTMKDAASRLFERQDEPLVIVDFGSSRGHGGNMVATGTHFQAPRSLLTKGLGLGSLPKRLKQPVPVKRMVNIDQFDLSKDLFMREWAKSCSIPPYEDTPLRRAEYDALDKLSGSNIEYSTNTIGRDKLFKYNPELEGACDIGYLCTVIYQSNQDTFNKIMQEARKILKPGGILIIQDHVKRRAHNQLEFTDQWYNPRDLPYRTILVDSLYPESGFVEIYRWTSGRCTEGTIPNRESEEALLRLSRPRQ